MISKSSFLEKSLQSISEIYDLINMNDSVSLSEFNNKDTVIIIIDMVNGFVKHGNLKSDRISEINYKISLLSKKASSLGICKLAFADCHTKDSTELLSYPVHCLENTYESEITDEISKSGKYHLIKKNSTNAFFAPEFKSWLNENDTITKFIIVGACTDICIMQFSLTLKAYFNQMNKNKEIIIPIDCVETYDNNTHNAELINLMTFYNMSVNGIKIVSKIED